MIYNAVLVSAIEQSESVYTHTHSLFFRFFTKVGHYRLLSRTLYIFFFRFHRKELVMPGNNLSMGTPSKRLS